MVPGSSKELLILNTSYDFFYYYYETQILNSFLYNNLDIIHIGIKKYFIKWSWTTECDKTDFRSWKKNWTENRLLSNWEYDTNHAKTVTKSRFKTVRWVSQSRSRVSESYYYKYGRRDNSVYIYLSCNHTGMDVKWMNQSAVLPRHFPCFTFLKSPSRLHEYLVFKMQDLS